MSSQWTKNRRRPNAFTLVELIIVMALLAVVISLSGPRLSNFFRGRALDSEATRFLALTRYGQSSAIAEGIPVQLWIDPDRGEYGLRSAPGFADDESVLAAKLETRHYQMANGLEIFIEDWAAQTGGLPLIEFSPEGHIDQESVTSLRFEEHERDQLWVALARNRLKYEIRKQTNIPARPVR